MAMYHHYYSSTQYNKKDIEEQPTYVPHDALQNLECYPTFSETLEENLQGDLNYLLLCDTHVKETQGRTQENMSNIQIIQESNIDTSLQEDLNYLISCDTNEKETQGITQENVSNTQIIQESNIDTSLEEELNYYLFCDTHEKETQGITQENVSNIQINQESNIDTSLEEELNYLLFCDTHEKETLKFNQLSEGITQENVSNVQINQESNIDTSLANIPIMNHENLPKNNKKSCSIKKSKDKSLKVKSKDKYKDRICSHCKTKDTTQWRFGPLGRNTLCNACGLRYKSNRLMEGYKPKASSNLDMLKGFRFSHLV
ncbi:GATA transcription factor [Trifolium repens]|nr:GATA transcription factor [Trifolium repens]